MAYPQQFLDEIRARLEVSEIVARKVALKRRGREFVGLSPFNAEKTPSFTVNDQKGFYHCFSSGKHGDIFSFLIETEGLSFPEAVERLAADAGLEVPRRTPEAEAQAKRRAGLREVLERATAWFEAQLALDAGRAARAYLGARGVSDALRRRFRLGYAPQGRGRLAQALAMDGIGESDLVEAGLVKPAEAGRGARDYFFDRIIFPITDPRGHVIAFGGRTLGEAQPKYLNSPETPLFRKGHVLYGIAGAREAAHRSGRLIVVEGYMDVIALAQAGLGEAVAPLGTALTEDQIALAWRLADCPILCFDGDDAGTRAALRVAERVLPLLRPGKSLRFVTLPPGEDPDSLLAHRGPGALDDVLGRARALVDVVFESEARAAPLDTPEAKADLERRLDLRTTLIADRSVQGHYRNAFRERRMRLFGYDRPRRRAGAYKAGAQRITAPAPGLRARGDVGAGRALQERAFVALIINHPWLVEHHFEALSTLALSARDLDTTLHAILNLAASGDMLDTEAVRRHLIANGLDAVLPGVLSADVYKMASFAAPDASREDAEAAVHDVLAWQRHSHMMAELSRVRRRESEDAPQ